MPVPRDGELVAIEKQLRLSIRDAVNRGSRRPFLWGGLVGYQQLAAIADALHTLPEEPETSYLRHLIPQLDRALEQNRSLAQDVEVAHGWLRRLADCLHYPLPTMTASASSENALSGQQVRHDVEDLLSRCQVAPFKTAQAALRSAWRRLWNKWGADLLSCYEVPDLPADNTKLEAFFGQLRSHQRRVSGRQSTQPLRDLGPYQALFLAEDQEDLL